MVLGLNRHHQVLYIRPHIVQVLPISQVVVIPVHTQNELQVQVLPVPGVMRVVHIQVEPRLSVRVTNIMWQTILALLLGALAVVQERYRVRRLFGYCVGELVLQAQLQLGEQLQESIGRIEVDIVRIVHAVLVSFQIGESAVVFDELVFHVGIVPDVEPDSSAVWNKVQLVEKCSLVPAGKRGLAEDGLAPGAQTLLPGASAAQGVAGDVLGAVGVGVGKVARVEALVGDARRWVVAPLACAEADLGHVPDQREVGVVGAGGGHADFGADGRG